MDYFEESLEKEQLHFAVKRGDVEKICSLLAEGFDVNSFDFLGNPPLHHAVAEELFEVVELLQEHGADVNAHCEARIGNTPLGDVTGTCSLRMAKTLIQAGADPLISGWMQIRAIDVAKDRNRGDGPQVYGLLLNRIGVTSPKNYQSHARQRKR